MLPEITGAVKDSLLLAGPPAANPAVAVDAITAGAAAHLVEIFGDFEVCLGLSFRERYFVVVAVLCVEDRWLLLLFKEVGRYC
jgi:hypothetical protein